MPHELRGGSALSSFLGRVYDALHGCCWGFRGIMTEAKTQDDDCFPRSTKSKNLLSPLLTSLRRLLRFMHANKARGVRGKKKKSKTERERKKTKTIYTINNLLRLLRLFPRGSLRVLASE